MSVNLLNDKVLKLHGEPAKEKARRLTLAQCKAENLHPLSFQAAVMEQRLLRKLLGKSKALEIPRINIYRQPPGGTV